MSKRSQESGLLSRFVDWPLTVDLALQAISYFRNCETGVKGARGDPRRCSITHSGDFKKLRSLLKRKPKI